MIFATTTRRNGFAAVPFFTLLALTAGCSSTPNEGTTNMAGSGGAGGSGASGGTGGSGASGGASGSAGAGGAGGSCTPSLSASPQPDAAGGAGGAGGTGGSGASGGGGGSSGVGGTGGGTGLYGSFIASFKNTQTPAFTQFIGRVYNGPQPPSQVLKLDSEEAGCQLLVPKVPFCTTPCTGGVCVDDNTCMPYPTAVGVGTAHVTGFKGGELTMSATGAGMVYQPSMTLPANACDEGADISVQTDKFTMQGKCIAPLLLTCGASDKVPVRKGEPVKLSWKPPSQPGVSRVEIILDIAHHGGKKGEIDCDVPDTGSFDIPATLTSKLVSLGLAGFPTIVVRRVSKAYAANEPTVKVQIDADVERDVDTGIVSCTDSTMCPTGQTCQADLTCK
jgi:hypothetical protein